MRGEGGGRVGGGGWSCVGGCVCVHVVGMSVLILSTGLHWATVYKSLVCVRIQCSL